MEIKYRDATVFPAKPFQVPKSACIKHTKNSQQGKFTPFKSKEPIETNRSAEQHLGPLPKWFTSLWRMYFFQTSYIVKRERKKIDWICYIQARSIFINLILIWCFMVKNFRLQIVLLHDHLWLLLHEPLPCNTKERLKATDLFSIHDSLVLPSPYSITKAAHSYLYAGVDSATFSPSFPCRDLTMQVDLMAYCYSNT